MTIFDGTLQHYPPTIIHSSLFFDVVLSLILKKMIMLCIITIATIIVGEVLPTKGVSTKELLTNNIATGTYLCCLHKIMCFFSDDLTYEKKMTSKNKRI